MGLAGDMVLLAFGARGDRLPDRQVLAPAVRGALLAELLDDGRLVDGGGAVRAAGDGAPEDAALRQVWEAVAAEPGRTWLHWVRAGGRASVHAVLRGLEKHGLLERGTSRVFGVFPLHRAVLTADGRTAAEGVRAAVAAVVEDPAAGAAPRCSPGSRTRADGWGPPCPPSGGARSRSVWPSCPRTPPRCRRRCGGPCATCGAPPRRRGRGAAGGVPPG
ncbi:GPP34 family phosphoprotein [Streptomyces sp. NPDC003090]|uniref:GOLPH3/VPS74 family protein n=1 Tax=Streptomyces sp. NPDC003090 TaxID=3154274 RepID=UPI003822EEF9